MKHRYLVLLIHGHRICMKAKTGLSIALDPYWLSTSRFYYTKYYQFEYTSEKTISNLSIKREEDVQKVNIFCLGQFKSNFVTTIILKLIDRYFIFKI